MEMEFGEILFENFAGTTSRKFSIYKGTIQSEIHPVIADSIENFEVRDDDVWICSYPRSGSTWTQEMIWNIVNDLDFERAQISLRRRIPHFEHLRLAPMVEPSANDLLEHIKNMANLPDPRIIKAHLPFHLLPRQLREGEKRSKIIHVSRNPKDACISYYHLHKLNFDYRGTLDDFSKAFIENKILYTPYWNHVNGYYEKKDRENIMFLTYEDMKKNLLSVIKKTASFLDKKLSESQIENLKNHLSFAQMQKNPSVNRGQEIELIYKVRGDSMGKEEFIRKGEVGQWKNVMSEEWIKRFDDWTKDNSKQFESS